VKARLSLYSRACTFLIERFKTEDVCDLLEESLEAGSDRCFLVLYGIGGLLLGQIGFWLSVNRMCDDRTASFVMVILVIPIRTVFYALHRRRKSAFPFNRL
jgi:hypothetical protein